MSAVDSAAPGGLGRVTREKCEAIGAMSEFLYLVSLCHAMDDVPMRICRSVEEAFSVAKALSWDVPAEMLQRLELPECSTPCCITVTTFQGGVPISRVIVRDYDSEEDTL